MRLQSYMIGHVRNELAVLSLSDQLMRPTVQSPPLPTTDQLNTFGGGGRLETYPAPAPENDIVLCHLSPPVEIAENVQLTRSQLTDLFL